MNFIIAADTDIGNTRQTNQDSIAVLTADAANTPVAFGVVCDGMGGLAKGELASTTLIHALVSWFKEDFPRLYSQGLDDSVIRREWTEIIRKNNDLIQSYGAQNGFHLGTTAAILLITQNRWFIANVGDSRIYEIGSTVRQLTEDQTVVAQELKYGRITAEQAKRDPRKSVLLQCVGASRVVNPDFFFGTPSPNTVFMLCSDGFRHEISDEEIRSAFSPDVLYDQDSMTANIRRLIELNKERQEKDNISAALIRTF